MHIFLPLKLTIRALLVYKYLTILAISNPFITKRIWTNGYSPET